MKVITLINSMNFCSIDLSCLELFLLQNVELFIYQAKMMLNFIIIARSCQIAVKLWHSNSYFYVFW